MNASVLLTYHFVQGDSSFARAHAQTTTLNDGTKN